jgi:hypothetical protein
MIPINVDNGGYKKKGTKILVLPQYTIVAKQVYEEFCDLTKRKTGNDHDMEMLDSDDATQVNRRSLRNPRDKNPLNARELIKSKNERIEMARYQRPAVLSRLHRRQYFSSLV